MYTLAFETSCDDTSIALFKDEQLLQMLTYSQLEEHSVTGGVVPEVAARLHEKKIFSLLDTVLKNERVSLDDIDLIACTGYPGLLPSLLVGKTVAKTIGYLHNIPVYYIDHIQGHIFSIFLDRDRKEVRYSSVVISISGGHNHLYNWTSLFEYEMIGQSRDDSCGEAFDKVAKMLGLGYPGGPVVEQYASQYTGEYKGIFPKVLLEKDSLDFSFSGLKSAVRREIEERGDLHEDDIIEICFEFQTVVIETLIEKLRRAIQQYPTDQIVLVGGVSANKALQEALEREFISKGVEVLYPKSLKYCGDNAGMIGMVGYLQYIHEKK